MIRQTSIKVYRQIQKEGLVKGWRWHVYSTLFHHGPLTQGECWKDHFSETQRHNVCPRFAELKKLGLIVEVGNKQCRVTGRNCISWDVTGDLPTKPKNKKPVGYNDAIDDVIDTIYLTWMFPDPNLLEAVRCLKK